MKKFTNYIKENTEQISTEQTGTEQTGTEQINTLLQKIKEDILKRKKEIEDEIKKIKQTDESPQPKKEDDINIDKDIDQNLTINKDGLIDKLIEDIKNNKYQYSKSKIFKIKKLQEKCKLNRSQIETEYINNKNSQFLKKQLRIAEINLELINKVIDLLPKK